MNQALFDAMDADIRERLLQFRASESPAAWDAAAQAFCFHGYGELDFASAAGAEFSRSVGKSQTDFLRMARDSARAAASLGLRDPWLRASARCIDAQATLKLRFGPQPHTEPGTTAALLTGLLDDLDRLPIVGPDQRNWVPHGFFPLSVGVAGGWARSITSGESTPRDWRTSVPRWLTWSAAQLRLPRALGCDGADRPGLRAPAIIDAWISAEAAIGDIDGLPAPSAALAALLRDLPETVAAPAAATSGTERPPSPPASSGSARRWAPLAVGVLGVGTLLCGLAGVGGWMAWEAEKAKEAAAAESSRLVASAWHILQAYKTDPIQNKDDSVIARALGEAKTAVETDASPEALGVYSLVLVWTQHWHYAKATWDEAKFADADSATTRALSAVSTTSPNPTAEALFARGLLTANACKLLPASDPRRTALCEDAATRFSAADALLDGDPRAWLRFELLWSEAAFYNRSALDARVTSAPAATADALQKTLSICTRGEADIASSPVNDRELGEECVVAAGASGDYATYFKWAGWLQDRSAKDNDGGMVSGSTVAMVYRAASPECSSLTFQTHNKWKRNVPELGRGSPPSAYFCYSVGLMALGCGDAATEALSFGQPLAPEFPWQAVASAYVPTGRGCYLTAVATPVGAALTLAVGTYPATSPEWRSARDAVVAWCAISRDAGCTAVVSGLTKTDQTTGAPECRGKLVVPAVGEATVCDASCNGGAYAGFSRTASGWVVARVWEEEAGD